MSKEKQAIEEMAEDLRDCHTEFECGVGEICTDYDTTAQKMFAKGYRKHSEGVWKKGTLVIFDREMVGYVCSECNTTWGAPTYYCANCGAKMKHENEVSDNEAD